jgi:hypothetical protein
MVVIQLPLLGRTKFLAFTVYPFIFVSNRKRFDANPNNIQHERIHARQQIEMLWVFFFVWYGIEFAIRALKRGRMAGYASISFEEEAYHHQDNVGYLENRKPFAWWEFL